MLNSYQHYFPIVYNLGSFSSNYYHLHDDGYYLQRVIYQLNQVGTLYVENNPGSWSSLGEVVYELNTELSSNTTSNLLSYVNQFYSDDWAYGFPVVTTPMYDIRNDDETDREFVGSSNLSRTDKRIGVNLSAITVPQVNIIFGTDEGIITGYQYGGHSYTLSNISNLTQSRPENEGGGNNPPTSGASYNVKLMNCSDGSIALSDNLLTLSEVNENGYELSGIDAYVINSTA